MGTRITLVQPQSAMFSAIKRQWACYRTWRYFAGRGMASHPQGREYASYLRCAERIKGAVYWAQAAVAKLRGIVVQALKDPFTSPMAAGLRRNLDALAFMQCPRGNCRRPPMPIATPSSHAPGRTLQCTGGLHRSILDNCSCTYSSMTGIPKASMRRHFKNCLPLRQYFSACTRYCHCTCQYRQPHSGHPPVVTRYAYAIPGIDSTGRIKARSFSLRAIIFCKYPCHTN